MPTANRSSDSDSDTVAIREELSKELKEKVAQRNDALSKTLDSKEPPVTTKRNKPVITQRTEHDTKLQISKNQLKEKTEAATQATPLTPKVSRKDQNKPTVIYPEKINQQKSGVGNTKRTITTLSTNNKQPQTVPTDTIQSSSNTPSRATTLTDLSKARSEHKKRVKHCKKRVRQEPGVIQVVERAEHERQEPHINANVEELRREQERRRLEVMEKEQKRQEEHRQRKKKKKKNSKRRRYSEEDINKINEKFDRRYSNPKPRYNTSSSSSSSSNRNDQMASYASFSRSKKSKSSSFSFEWNYPLPPEAAPRNAQRSGRRDSQVRINEDNNKTAIVSPRPSRRQPGGDGNQSTFQNKTWGGHGENSGRILGYWDIRGQAEPIRYLLEFCSLPYHDKRYPISRNSDSSIWMNDAKKHNLDPPNLPYYVSKTVKQTQSLAILRSLGRENNLIAKGDQNEYKQDILEQKCLDLRWNIGRVVFAENFEESKKKYIETLPQSLTPFENILDKGKWLLGEQITYVDFLFYETLDWIRLFSGENYSQYPKLQEYCKRFENLPGVKEYIRSRPAFPIFGPLARWGYNPSKPAAEPRNSTKEQQKSEPVKVYASETSNAGNSRPRPDEKREQVRSSSTSRKPNNTRNRKNSVLQEPHVDYVVKDSGKAVSPGPMIIPVIHSDKNKDCDKQKSPNLEARRKASLEHRRQILSRSKGASPVVEGDPFDTEPKYSYYKVNNKNAAKANRRENNSEGPESLPGEPYEMNKRSRKSRRSEKI